MGDGTVIDHIVSALGPTTIGAAGGYLASRFQERYKRKRVLADDRRKAYATWFTAEAELQLRAKDVLAKIKGFPQDASHHFDVTQAVQSLLVQVAPMLVVTNEAYLVEPSRRTRKLLSTLSEAIVRVLRDLDFAARHYGENLQFHEQIDDLTDEYLESLPLQVRWTWEQVRADFLKHDATCPFKSDEFQREMEEHIDRTHSLSLLLREQVASSLVE